MTIELTFESVHSSHVTHTHTHTHMHSSHVSLFLNLLLSYSYQIDIELTLENVYSYQTLIKLLSNSHRAHLRECVYTSRRRDVSAPHGVFKFSKISSNVIWYSKLRKRLTFENVYTPECIHQGAQRRLRASWCIPILKSQFYGYLI